MPSGKTHDAITLVLAAPAFAATYMFSRSLAAALLVTAAFVFGGLMFGPDLDTVSRQYSRWFILRPLWFPYRMCFKHRSRFSHGLVFGALFRVIYFMGILTLAVLSFAVLQATYIGGRFPQLSDIARAWQPIGDFTRASFGEHFLLYCFIGLWFGAASHTLTDIAGTFIKSGKRAKLF